MSTIPLVRVNAVLPFVKFAQSIGSPVHQLLSQAKLPAYALSSPEALVPVQPVFTFTEQLAQSEDIPCLGLRVAHQAQIADLGILGKLMQQSLSLYDLLNVLGRVIGNHNSIDKLWLTEDGDHIWLNHTYNCTLHATRQQIQRYSVLMYVKAIQLAAGSEWCPPILYLQTGYVNGLADIQQFSNSQVYFNQPHNAIAIPKSMLSLPLANTARQSLLPSKRDVSWWTSAPALDFVGSLQQVIQLLLPEGYPQIEYTAEAAGKSVRSLQRRLAEECLSYSRLVDQVRFDTAISELRDPDVHIVDIALDLGYTDAANFTRAFKRWTGISPRKFRQLHGGMD
jgi:AraC-like DNA-binding protein